MANVFFRSFDNFTAIADFQNHDGLHCFANATWCSISTAVGPNSINAMHVGFNSTTQVFWGIDLRAASGIGPMTGGGVMGERINFESTASGLYGVISFYEATFTNVHFSIQRDSNGTINLRRGNGSGTVLGSSAASAVPADTWGFLEVKWSAVGSSVDMSVRWNGVAIITVTSVNNQGSTGTSVGGIAWGGWSNSQDVYLLDLTGSAPLNDFLYSATKDVRVYGKFPNSTDATQWTPNTSTNLSRISAIVNTANYNSTTVNSNQDTFGTAGSLASYDVLAACVRVIFSQSVTSGATVKTVLKSGATTGLGASFTPVNSGTPTMSTDYYLTDPNTSVAWTLANFNGATFGYKINSYSSGTIKAFQVYVETLVQTATVVASTVKPLVILSG